MLGQGHNMGKPSVTFQGSWRVSYSTDTWIGPNSSYGYQHYNITTNFGTASDPVTASGSMGFAVTGGMTLRKIVVGSRASGGVSYSQIEVALHHRADDGTETQLEKWGALDVNTTNSTVISEYITASIPSDGALFITARAVGTLSSDPQLGFLNATMIADW